MQKGDGGILWWSRVDDNDYVWYDNDDDDDDDKNLSLWHVTYSCDMVYT